MLERKAMRQIEKWHRGDARKALLIKGARQIGKTTVVRQFARTHYKNFVELNFLEDARAHAIFDDSLDADSLVAALTSYVRKPLDPGNTLILFDEVQECPRARMAVKFLVEDGRFDYIETGSLLGVKSRQVGSYPVGFEEHLQMYPLDFEEFCLANGVQPQALNSLRECFEKRVTVNPAVHGAMMKLFFAYMVVGGMPEVVQRYVDTHDVAQAMALQKGLLDLYRLDIAKYAENGDAAKARSVFDAIPAQLDDKNRRFVLADIDKNARQNRYASSFLWLVDAGVALPCYNVQQPVAPLEANCKHSLFKLFMGDTGLLCAATLGNIQFDLLQGNTDVNVGSITENVVAQELKSNGFNLNYFNNKRYGEVDFIVQDGAKVIPVEVKSGNDWRAHKALHNVLSVEQWHMDEAFVLCKGNVECDGSIVYLPLYMTMFLRPTPAPESLVYQVDLSALDELTR